MITRVIRLIEIVYRIFEYSFVIKIICSFTFRIFVLALIFDILQGRRLWCGWYGHGRITFELEQQYSHTNQPQNNHKVKTDLLAKDRYTLIEQSNTLIKHSDHLTHSLLHISITELILILM